MMNKKILNSNNKYSKKEHLKIIKKISEISADEINLPDNGNHIPSLKKFGGQIIIGHPGGKMICEGEVEMVEGEWKVNRAGFIRHARILMEGWVYY